MPDGLQAQRSCRRENHPKDDLTCDVIEKLRPNTQSSLSGSYRDSSRCISASRLERISSFRSSRELPRRHWSFVQRLFCRTSSRTATPPFSRNRFKCRTASCVGPWPVKEVHGRRAAHRWIAQHFEACLLPPVADCHERSPVERKRALAFVPAGTEKVETRGSNGVGGGHALREARVVERAHPGTRGLVVNRP